MKTWTKKRMEETDNLLFALCILNERANKLNSESLLYKKISAACNEIEVIRDQRIAEEDEQERLERDTYDTLYELVMAKYVRMKILHDHLWNAPFVRAIDIDELDMKVSNTEMIKFKDDLYCAIYFRGATKPSCYLKAEAMCEFIYAIYEDIGDGIYGIDRQFEQVVFATDAEAYKRLEEIKIEKGMVSRKSTSKYLYDTLCNLIIHEGVEIPSFVSIPFEDHCLPPRIEPRCMDNLYLVADDDDIISAGERDYYAVRKYGTVDIIGYLREDAINEEVYIIYEELEKGKFGVPKDKCLNDAVFLTYYEAEEELKETLKDW
jgi:hypothetical protein